MNLKLFGVNFEFSLLEVLMKKLVHIDPMFHFILFYWLSKKESICYTWRVISQNILIILTIISYNILKIGRYV